MQAKDIAAMLNALAGAHRDGDPSEAVAALEEIMRRLWDHRMRARLAALVEEGGEDLSEIALEAARRIVGGDDGGAA
jgi:hypothetical protein